MGMKLGRIVIGFEQGNMENRMETGEIGRETEFVSEVRDSVVNGEGTKATVFELIGWARGLDVPAHKPYKLIRLVDRGRGDAFIVVARLGVLSFT